MSSILVPVDTFRCNICCCSPLAGPRTVPTRLDFDSEKTPGEVCQHRPLALSEVRPLNMGVVSPPQVPAHLESPSVAPPPPSITFGAPTQTQQLPSTPALMTVYPTPHGSVYDEPAHGTPSTPAHHSVFPVTQTPTIHPAHSITVQVRTPGTSCAYSLLGNWRTSSGRILL